ncbi:MFS transporter [Butyrivibrio proteoclasticus]|uniref:MFS transporter n=1 Tax=Butyrivibrio proteoclasticus TaxID=43305 RepID=UPI00047A0635|nr:MFS transporter [Butyrivibrio proteoclasticus]
MGKRAKGNPLWTRDFTIITVGSIVSMFGNSMTGFAMSLMVLDYTGSTMLYAIYLSMYTIPQLLAPIVSGAILDRFSRKKMIYSLDFAMAGLYLFVALMLKSGWFNFAAFALFTFIVGCVNSTYMVAYDSFYPLLITEGNYSKAYSIASVLETFATFMVPVATFFYGKIGIAPLLMINAVCFFAAAVLETRIGAKEEYIDRQKRAIAGESASKISRVLMDIREGFEYLLSERGLLAIAVYFLFSSMAGGAASVICLPYYRDHYIYGEYVYMGVFGMSFVGRGVTGLFHYMFKIPEKYKFRIAIAVYVIIGLFEGMYLFVPFQFAMFLAFIVGVGGVTSYTIRISSTQSYVPDEKKGRFNGAFQVLSTTGTLIAELAAGAMTVAMSGRAVLFLFEMLSVIAAVVVIGGNKRFVEKIYNRNM